MTPQTPEGWPFKLVSPHIPLRKVLCLCEECKPTHTANKMNDACLSVHQRIVAEKDREIERLKEGLQKRALH